MTHSTVLSSVLIPPSIEISSHYPSLPPVLDRVWVPDSQIPALVPILALSQFISLTCSLGL